MKRSTCRDEQIIDIVKQGENGLAMEECCRQHEISTQTFCRQRATYGGVEVSEVSEARRSRELEEISP